MNTSLLCRLAVACLLFGGLSARASDWPRFQGPNGSGISTDKGLPVKWTDRDQVFKIALPGVGNSSPIVCKGRIFIHASAEDGKERSLLCLDAGTGKTLWTRTIKAQKAHINGLNSLASATPAADGERVFNAFWDGREVILYAYDFEGKELWKHSFGGFASQHGAGASPVVYDGKVYFLHDQDKAAAADKAKASLIACLDAKTGAVVWQKTRPAERACYSCPMMLEEGGKKELIVVTTPQITSYNPANGDINWRYDWKFDTKPLRTVGSPALAKGLLIAPSGDGNGDRHLIAVRAGGQGNVTATNLAWEVKKFKWTAYVPCILASGEYLFTVNDFGYVSCVTAKDGKEVWRERLAGNVYASPVLVEGKMIVIDSVGKVYFVEAGPEFKLLAQNDLKEGAFASPAVADGKLYIRTRSGLVCIGKK